MFAESRLFILYLNLFDLVCLPLAATFITTNILDCAFASFTRRPLPLVTGESLIDFGIFLMFLIIFSQVKFDSLGFNVNSPRGHYDLMFTLGGGKGSNANFYGIFSSLVWMKMLYLIKMNMSIGPLIKVIFRMSQDVLRFGFLLVLVLLTFTSIGIVIFTIPEFFTFQDALITLYSWMLGDFSF